jgi:hypothetical protein
MENPIKMIYQFNLQAGLLDNGYDDFLESSMLVEEAIEGFDDLEYLAVRLAGDSPETIPSPLKARDVSRQIIALAEMDSKPTSIPDVDRLDKACDAVIIALGSIFKLGLTPAQATRALNIVMRHNFKKLSMPKDEYGKLTKPADFVGPEAALQALLDER